VEPRIVLVLIAELALCHRLPPRNLRWFLDFGKFVHHCFRVRLISNLRGGNKENGKKLGQYERVSGSRI